MAIFLLASVFLIYGVFGFFLYRARFISSWASSESDLVTFALPFLLAVMANAGVFFFWMRPHSFGRVAWQLAVSFALAVVAWWLYMVCAVNTYGE